MGVKREETTLLLLRHGEPEGFGRLLGRRTDPPLTARGEEQARRMAERLAAEPIRAFYASGLARARKTAEILAEPFNLPVAGVDEVAEMDMGRWGGREMAAIWREEPDVMRAWWEDMENVPTPGGESLVELRARVLPAVAALIERHRGETVCLVAHGGVNRVILFEVMGVRLKRFHAVEQDYACLNRIRYFEDGNAVVTLVNSLG